MRITNAFYINIIFCITFSPNIDILIGIFMFDIVLLASVGSLCCSETYVLRTVTFPEQYPAEQLAGKDAVFTVVLNSIKEKKIPELTDEYVAGLGIENVNTIDGLKTYMRQQLEIEAQNDYETQLNNSAMQKMIEICDFTDEIPEDRYKYYYDNVINMDSQYAAQFGVDLDTFVTGYYGFENAGEKVTDKMVEEDIAENLENYGVSTVEEFKENYNIDEYKSYLINRKALEIIKENAKIVAPAQAMDTVSE